MIEKTPPLEQALALAEKLSPADKARLIEKLASALKQDISETPDDSVQSLYGLWADLNLDISEHDIDEVRRNMWDSFPREDI